MPKVKKTRVVPGNGSPDKPRLNEKGQEVLDDTPVTLPVRYQRGENITERVQRMVEETLSRRAAEQGLESVDEANDFDIPGEDYFPTSEHEVDEYAEQEFREREGQRASGFFIKRKTQPAPKGDGGNKEEAKSPPEPTKGPDKGAGGN